MRKKVLRKMLEKQSRAEMKEKKINLKRLFIFTSQKHAILKKFLLRNKEH